MDFVKNNPKLVTLAVALALVIAGAVAKVDVVGILKQVGLVNQEVTTLVAEPAPAQ